MLITEVHVEAFGKLKEENFSLRAGLSVITGDNEIGKTTMADFIKSVLFGLVEGENDYRHYYPYDFDGKFGGSLKLLLKTGLFYEVRRDFLSNYLTVKKVSDGTVIEDAEAWMRDVCQGLTKEQYQNSGYISQNMFLFDAEKYKDTIAKDSKRKKEETVRSELLNARTLLIKKREDFSAQLDDQILQKLNEVEDLMSAQAEELEKLTKIVAKKEESLSTASASLTEDRERVSRENQFKEQNLLDTMLSDKQHLAEYTDLNEFATRKKNSLGIICLVLGALLGLAAFFFRSSFGITKSANKIIFFAAVGLAAVCVVVGIVISIITFCKKKKTNDAVEHRDLYIQRLAYSEREYQSFMSGEAGTHVCVTNEAERQEEIDTLTDDVNDMNANIETLSQAQADCEKRKTELTKNHENQKVARAEIKALDIAIGTLSKLTGVEENSEETDRSERATDILLHMNDKRDSVISIENDIVFVTENGRRLLFSDLSTSSMQEVLFSIRLAILNEMDPKQELPLILDESFANLDGERLQRVMRFVRNCGRQAILFSCQTREKKEMARE